MKIQSTCPVFVQWGLEVPFSKNGHTCGKPVTQWFMVVALDGTVIRLEGFCENHGGQITHFSSSMYVPIPAEEAEVFQVMET